MKRRTQSKPAPRREGIVIRPGSGAPLSRTQVEFNRLMKSLESAKARHAREQSRLDEGMSPQKRSEIILR